jgi:hypothetical protein
MTAAVAFAAPIRMHYRNRRQALSSWRASVCDAAVLALAVQGKPMPISVLSAAIGVDVGAMYGLLSNDPSKRFRMTLDEVPRCDGGHRSARFVSLAHLSDPARVARA